VTGYKPQLTYSLCVNTAAAALLFFFLVNKNRAMQSEAKTCNGYEKMFAFYVTPEKQPSWQRRPAGSISPTFYQQLLLVQIPKAQKDRLLDFIFCAFGICAFGICARKSCSKNVGEIDPSPGLSSRARGASTSRGRKRNSRGIYSDEYQIFEKLGSRNHFWQEIKGH